MFYRESLARLGMAMSLLIEFSAEINLVADSLRVLTAQSCLSSLKRVKTYSGLLEALDAGLICPDDREQLASFLSMENLVTSFCDGEQTLRCELRLVGDHGRSEWFEVRFVRFDGSGAFNGRIILVMNNIEAQKGLEARAAELSEQVERDPLTGLYNKRAAQTLIDSLLEGDGHNGRHTLLLCDLDEFKSVNDNLGHPFGDALLTDVSAKFGKTFRRDDIVCRIGGDEFVVLMQNTSGRSYVARRADLLLDRMKQAFPLGDHLINVTMSIGIASYPECGTTYAELFANADKAMYMAKLGGKNQYCFFDDTPNGSDRFGHPRSDEIAEPRAAYHVHGKISDYIFSCLYESNDFDRTLPLMLQLMGAHFDLSRVLLAEIDSEHGQLRVSRRWESCVTQTADKPIAYTGELRALFESSITCENMMLRYPDARELPESVRRVLDEVGFGDVKAFLQCPLLDGGAIRGYIVFCDCRATRTWTDEERDTLGYAARLISLFVFKQQAYEQTLAALKLNRQLLDSSPAMLYVADPDTHELLYASRSLTEHVPEARVGAICHEVFHGSDEPCAVCPMAGWRRQGEQGVCQCEVYSEHLDDWTASTATGIVLQDGRKACLCSCYSIAKYKHRERKLEQENDELSRRIAQDKRRERELEQENSELRRRIAELTAAGTRGE